MKKNDSDVIIIEVATTMLRLIIINKESNKIIATSNVNIDYIKRGVVKDVEALTKSIRNLISQTNKNYLNNIKKVVIALSGAAISSISSSAEIKINNKKNIVDESIIEEIFTKVENKIPENISQNKKLIQLIPQKYKIDGKNINTNKPNGLSGNIFELQALCIFATKQHLENILLACEENNLMVEDVIVAEYAYSKNQVNEADRLAGVCVVNIGGDTSTIITYDENIPILLEVIPLGSEDITRDIALGLKVSLEQAKNIKTNPDIELRRLASELTEVFMNRNRMNIKRDQRDKAFFLSLQEKYHEIIYARIIDIFELIQKHLKKIGKDRLLPAGIIIHGGGAMMKDIDVISKEILRLPTQIRTETVCNKDLLKFKQSQNICVESGDTMSIYATGLYYLDQDESEYYANKGRSNLSVVIKNILEWIKQFLP
jgi:cell division protein FtsA